MTLPASGLITLAQLQAEFGGPTPIYLSSYYRGGAYTTANNAAVSAAGLITLDQFHGAVKYVPGSYDFPVGTSTWTVPAGVTTVHVYLVGAGGSGAAQCSYNGDWFNGSAGGAGGHYDNYGISVTAGQVLTVVVGSGHAGGAAYGGQGVAGDNSSVSGAFGTLTATGGGKGNATNNFNAPGGTAGSPGGTAGTNGASGYSTAAVAGVTNGTGYGSGGGQVSGGSGIAGGNGRAYLIW